MLQLEPLCLERSSLTSYQELESKPVRLIMESGIPYKSTIKFEILLITVAILMELREPTE